MCYNVVFIAESHKEAGGLFDKFRDSVLAMVNADQSLAQPLAKCVETYAKCLFDGGKPEVLKEKAELEAELKRRRSEKKFQETKKLLGDAFSDDAIRDMVKKQLEAEEAIEKEDAGGAMDLDKEIEKAQGKKTIERGDMGDSDEEDEQPIKKKGRGGKKAPPKKK